MGIFDKIKGMFGDDVGPYEEAHRERVSKIRTDLDDEATVLDTLLAALAELGAVVEEGGSPGDARLLEDLALGDVEMMELELLCEDLFSVDLSAQEMNRPETVGGLAALIERKRGG